MNNDPFYIWTKEEIDRLKKTETTRMDKADQYDIYIGFVEEQKDYFMKSIDKILELLQQLVMQNKLYVLNTRLTARIKDAESAINNDILGNHENDPLMKTIIKELSVKDVFSQKTDGAKVVIAAGKALDDIFGISIVVDTQEEINEIVNILKTAITVFKEKDIDKEGYHAKHLYVWQEKDERYPVIECQLKTVRSDIESYDHTIYKVECLLGRKLTESGKQKVWNIIQEFYNQGNFTITRNIPRMWEARFNEGMEKFVLTRLREGQVIKRVYPHISIKSNIIDKGESK